METIKNYRGYIAIGLAVIGLVALVTLTSKTDDTKTADSAKDKTTQTDKATEKKEETKTPATTDTTAVYNYTAQPGDSYSVLARKAVQTYGINEGVKLSLAQILAAETRLTIDAGSIELNEGQTVAIEKSAVKTAVEAAQKLGVDDVAAWEAYVPYVDFNTNAAGQAARA